MPSRSQVSSKTPLLIACQSQCLSCSLAAMTHFPKVLMEALALGKPCIAFEVGGVADLSRTIRYEPFRQMTCPHLSKPCSSISKIPPTKC